ncbi:(R)-stereoselective amidase [Baekduia alba]|uniref:carbon-nitrogen hydrolase family protein n=1 Tax=Baekduia alba TaxID=2997333 RepID=UPI00233FD8E7|nr:carbon-nitrogen hydrolase family protein [Baekduia alba]WCB96333.1 (R)-stereoselective amidase [Baekduia alba]
MQDQVHLSVVQLVPVPLAPEANVQRMVEWVRDEGAAADVVVFPELATTGYVPPEPTAAFTARLRDASERVPGRLTDALAAVAQETRTHVVAGFSELGDDGELYNSIVWVHRADGALHVHRKAHLFQRERAYFAAGDRFEAFDTDLGRVGLQVCYDSKYPEVSRLQALAGAELMIAVFAYAPDPGVPADILQHRAVVRAWENGAFYVAANRLGREGDDAFAGRSAVAGPTGRILTDPDDATAPVVRAVLDAGDFALAGRDALLVADRRPDLYGTPGPNERNPSR